MLLKRIAFLGPGKQDAALEFRAGINVICGASETGKSFVVEAIDFMLGGGSDLRDLPESIGYTRVEAIWMLGDGNTEEARIERSKTKGNYTLISPDGVPAQDTTLKEKASGERTDTLSAFMLSKIGLFPKKIKRNAKNEVSIFSIRDLSRLTVVPEVQVEKLISPYLSGQVVSATAEYSALKLMLTGEDDSALKADAEERANLTQRKEAKIELLDDMVAKLATELEAGGETEEETSERMERLDAALVERRAVLDDSRAEVADVEQQRRLVYREVSRRRARVGEIGELIGRFTLLDRHYENDLQRLEAVRETGSYFVHLDSTPCPLCGAAAEHQRLDEPCDGDTEAVIIAAGKEIEKINRLRDELAATTLSLGRERGVLNEEQQEFEGQFSALDKVLRDELSTNVRELQDAYQEVLDAHLATRKILWKFDRLRELKDQRDQLSSRDEEEAKTEKAATKIPQASLDDLSQRILSILKAWEFPDANRVHFDEVQRDFVIDGKPRGSRGKGLRAITHAAATIGLLEHCRAKNLPHSGVVVMDSPLLSYYAPEGDEDDLKGTNLKLRFYEYLAAHHRDSQIIIIENEAPPDTVQDLIAVTTFTRNPHQGRFGFFPTPPQPAPF